MILSFARHRGRLFILLLNNKQQKGIAYDLVNLLSTINQHKLSSTTYKASRPFSQQHHHPSFNILCKYRSEQKTKQTRVPSSEWLVLILSIWFAPLTLCATCRNTTITYLSKASARVVCSLHSTSSNTQRATQTCREFFSRRWWWWWWWNTIK